MKSVLDPSITTISNYKIGEVLGSGFFGELRIGTNEKSGQKVAIKIERVDRKTMNQYLALEKKFYDMIHHKQKQVGFPMIYLYGTDPRGFNFLVMELMGPSLEQLKRQNGGVFSHRTVVNIAMHTLKRIQKLHSLNILYRDVKPENFVIGLDENRVCIHLIDLGLSRELFLPDGTHYPLVKVSKFLGTTRYMSINANEGYEQSRRDDLESLAYMFIYLVKGSLPWQGVKENNMNSKFLKIGQMKRQTPISTLCAGISDVYKKFLEYARNLAFEDQPSYDCCHSMFEAELQSLNQAGMEARWEFDWLRPESDISLCFNRDGPNGLDHNLCFTSEISGCKTSFAINVSVAGCAVEEENQTNKISHIATAGSSESMVTSGSNRESHPRKSATNSFLSSNRALLTSNISPLTKDTKVESADEHKNNSEGLYIKEGEACSKIEKSCSNDEPDKASVNPVSNLFTNDAATPPDASTSSMSFQEATVIELEPEYASELLQRKWWSCCCIPKRRNSANRPLPPR